MNIPYDLPDLSLGNQMNTEMNKTGTSKVGAIPQKKVSKHPKGAFRARKTLQKFAYSVLRQMGALIFEPPPLS